jgi:hypothetical protein
MRPQFAPAIASNSGQGWRNVCCDGALKSGRRPQPTPSPHSPTKKLGLARRRARARFRPSPNSSSFSLLDIFDRCPDSRRNRPQRGGQRTMPAHGRLCSPQKARIEYAEAHDLAYALRTALTH